MCLFCDIVEGKIPSKKIYEDDDALVILDISQATRGHSLVIPKKHFDDILDVDEESFQKLSSVLLKMTKQIVEKTGAEGCNVLNNCKEVAGQTIPHLHFHIIPRYTKNDIQMAFTAHEDIDLDELLDTLK